MTSTSQNFSDTSDEALILLARQGDVKAEQCIFERYRDSVRLTAAACISNFAVSCSLSSLDSDDLIQEGLLGLLSAIYSFLPEKNVSFRTYSARCISNSIKTAVKTSTRKKNTPSGGVISIYDIDIPSDTTPEDKIISEEFTDSIYSFLQNDLSPLEASVIRRYLSGMKYKDIGEELGLTEKAVDNALQRIRGKLSKFLDKSRS